MFKRIKDYIGIGKLGLLEFIIALYPILAGYGYGSFQLAFGVLLILDIFIWIRVPHIILNSKPLKVLFTFIVLHDVVFLAVIPEVTSYYVNSLIATVIYVMSVLIIAPQLHFEKLKSSIYIVGIICMVGMVYHVFLLSLGQSVSPIKLPFLPDMEANSRLFSINERPTSFFWEPQSYASFMLVPLYFALRDKKMLFAFIIALTMFVSTSTTGLLLSIFMIVLSLGGKNSKWYIKVLGVIAICLLAYFLVTSDYTARSLEKLENTNIEESNRIINGYLIATDLSLSDWLTGIPFASYQDAYEANYFHVPLIVFSDGVLFISAFWIGLINYGILGFILFIIPYFWAYRKSHALLPYVACTFVALFSNPDFIGASYVFQFLIMLTVIQYEKNKNITIA